MGDDVTGTAISLHRYPIKSMLGEAISSSTVTDRGLLGDRAFALVDTVTGRVASAKNPKAWPNLLGFRASYVEPPASPAQDLPPVLIVLPDGSEARSDDPDVDQILSVAVGRSVTLARSLPAGAMVEQYHPDLEDLAPEDHRDQVTEFAPALFAPGTFFDALPLHLLTTATLSQFKRFYPEGRWETARFRPNVVIEVEGVAAGYPENDWVMHDAILGADVRLNVVIPVPRCVMTTLAQDGLPKDNRILQTATQQNRLDVAGQGRYPCVGVYAGVAAGGTVRSGDALRVL
jgi:hypothetical protein